MNTADVVVIGLGALAFVCWCVAIHCALNLLKKES